MLMFRIPDRPLQSACQVSRTLFPRGVTAPRPVITTLFPMLNSLIGSCDHRDALSAQTAGIGHHVFYLLVGGLVFQDLKSPRLHWFIEIHRRRDRLIL